MSIQNPEATQKQSKLKTKRCRNYPHCGYVNCLYAHNVAELQPLLVAGNFKTKKCKKYPNCSYLQNCQFSHEVETVYQLNKHCRRCFVYMYPDGFIFAKICFRTKSQQTMCTCFENAYVVFEY